MSCISAAFTSHVPGGCIRDTQQACELLLVRLGQVSYRRPFEDQPAVTRCNRHVHVKPVLSRDNVGEGSNGLSSITNEHIHHDFVVAMRPPFLDAKHIANGGRDLKDQAFNYATFRWLDVASGCHQMGLRRKERPTIPSGPPARRP